LSIEIIGAGFGRTGTLSLKQALETLGFGPCYHMTEVLSKPENFSHVPLWTQAAEGVDIDWRALLDGYRSTVDWPGCRFWREMRSVWPEAKVILSLRDADRWYDSVMKTIWPASSGMMKADDEPLKSFGVMHDRVIWSGTFSGRIEDRAHAKHVFEEHNAEVKRSVPTDRLLVYEPGDGWEPLCAFLGVAVPDEPYPHSNSSEDFGREMSRLGTPVDGGKK
jgi:hypothetical protein